MKYIDFLNKFREYPTMNQNDIRTVFSDFNRRLLYDWQKTDRLRKITKGFYVFSDKKLTEDDLNFIANRLREPSYLSLEYALNYYSLIPETVFVRTSISSKKTFQMKTTVGNFSYRSIKKNLFFGYIMKGQGNAQFKIAEPEKALLDFLYLRTDIKNTLDLESLRLNKERYRELVSEEKINRYLEQFHSPNLNKKIKLLNNLMKQND